MFGASEMIRKHFLIGFVFLIAICAGTVSAQKKAKPDFTGTWVLDLDKSAPLTKWMLKKRPDPSGAVEKRTTETLTITHTEPQFEVAIKETLETLDSAGKVTGKTETVLSTLILFTDKRGEINTFPWDQQHSSVTTWKNKEIFTSVIIDKGNSDLGILKFALSKNGKELKVTTVGIYGGEIDLEAKVMVPMAKVYTKVDQ